MSEAKPCNALRAGIAQIWDDDQLFSGAITKVHRQKVRVEVYGYFQTRKCSIQFWNTDALIREAEVPGLLKKTARRSALYGSKLLRIKFACKLC